MVCKGYPCFHTIGCYVNCSANLHLHLCIYYSSIAGLFASDREYRVVYCTGSGYAFLQKNKYYLILMFIKITIMKIFSFLNYLLFIAIITVIILLIYASVQQTYRSGANDPQIQIAEDISAKIQKGKNIEDIFPVDTIDIAQSLALVVILYDAHGRPLRSTGFLDGKMPQLPAGVFDFAKKNGSHSVTWQPNNDVRMAMVLNHINSSPVEFVAAGRSLREV